MSAPHPTIPGVTVKVESYQGGSGSPVHTYRDLEITGTQIGVSASTQRREIRITPGFSPEHAGTVASMILDQAAWLKEQDTDR